MSLRAALEQMIVNAEEFADEVEPSDLRRLLAAHPVRPLSQSPAEQPSAGRPTREQIDEVLQLHRVGVGDPRHHDPRFPGALANYRRKLRNALLALFSGSEE